MTQVRGPLEVLGHESTLESLRETRSSSLLFVGPSGVGRRRAARWLAALLNCQAAEEARPCGTCDSCRRFERGHPDHREVLPSTVTGSGRRNLRPEIKIGQLVPRQGENEGESLTRWLEQRPAFRRRVGVIDGAHRMTVAAANSFLKMLEEPPSYASIILIAPSPQALLPTIASRCMVFRFGTVDTAGLGAGGVEAAGTQVSDTEASGTEAAGTEAAGRPSGVTADHPAHRLGRPGPLLEPAEDAAAVQDAVERFVASLNRDLESGLAAADALATSWQGSGEPGLPGEALREKLRSLDPRRRVRADDLILACGEAIEGYSSPGLATRVLLLELRNLLQ